MDLPTELIDGILEDFPAHRPGTRPVFSSGISVSGWFQPTDVAGRYTSAAPLTTEVPVTVRFSNGTGDSGVPDTRRDVRGMAVRFYGGDPRQAALDMVCMTLPVFPVRSVESFRELTAAAVPPDPPRPRRWWRDLVDYASLRTPLKDPAPGDEGLLAFASRHPGSCPALLAYFNQGAPESYATRSYHAAHAFALTAADGSSRYARFHWEPVSGVRDTATGSGHFLQDDLRARVAARNVQFVLRAQIADQGDDTSDPTRPWPQTRRRVVLGHVSLDGPVHDPAVCEALEFDPHRLPPGIGCDPADEIFAVRGEAYRASQAWRREQTQP
ncbi:MAG: catalase [Acidimicrobiales bacterium]